MAIQASTQDIQNMKRILASTAKDIVGIQKSISECKKKCANWNDAQGQKFREIMENISNSVTQPVQSLNDTARSLSELEKALDNYNKVKF